MKVHACKLDVSEPISLFDLLVDARWSRKLRLKVRACVFTVLCSTAQSASVALQLRYLQIVEVCVLKGSVVFLAVFTVLFER